MKIDIIMEALGTIVLVVGIASLSIPIGIMAAGIALMIFGLASEKGR